MIVLTNSYSSIKCHPKKKKKIVLGDKHHNKILEESLDIFRIIPFYLKIVVGAFSGRIGLPPAVMGWAASCDGGP